MANGILNQAAETINNNDAYEAILKLESLLNVAIDGNLKEQTAQTIHGYLWTLSDLALEAKRKILL